jgi:type 1 fimbria pilin
MLIVFKKSHRNIARLSAAAGLLMAALIPLGAQASCNVDRAVDLNFHVDDLMLSRNLPVGAVIYETTANDPRGNQNDIFTCQGGGVIKTHYTVGGLVKSEVYSTSVEGVGYRLLLADQPLLREYSVRCTSTPCITGYPVEPVYKLQLIKTSSAQTSGVLHAGRYAYLETDSGDVIANINITTAALTLSACSVVTKDVYVDLGDIDIKRFTGVGATAGKADFTIALNCDEKMPFSLTFNAKPAMGGSTEGIIALSDEGRSAEGVGIRMKHNGEPVVTGKEIVFEAQSAGTSVLPFSAEYVQLHNTVKAGTGNAIATFSLRYD